MNEKNTVITNYTNYLLTMVQSLLLTVGGLAEDPEINRGIITTADIQINAIKSQTVVLQNALDNYFTDGE